MFRGLGQLGDPASGEPHPDFPGCYWSPVFRNYVCDDGFTVDGQPLPGALDTDSELVSSSVRPLSQVGISELSQVIRQNGGQYIASPQDELVRYAQSRWWQFSVSLSTDGTQARVTENNYLLYGGLGLAGLLLFLFIRQ